MCILSTFHMIYRLPSFIQSNGYDLQARPAPTLLSPQSRPKSSNFLQVPDIESRPKSVPSSPMVKRAFSRLGTITAGWGRSIRSKQSQLNVEDKKKWASSQDCSGERRPKSQKVSRGDFYVDTLGCFDFSFFHSLSVFLLDCGRWGSFDLISVKISALLLLLAERKGKTEINLRIAFHQYTILLWISHE